MAWYVIYETTTGRLISSGGTLTDELNPSYTSADIDTRPNLKQVMWDAASRDFIARPVKALIDRWQNFLTLPRHQEFQDMYNALNATRKQVIRTQIWRAFGENRYITQDEDNRGIFDA